MFTTRLQQPAPQYRGLGRERTSHKAAWQGRAVSNVAGMDRSFGGSPALEAGSCLFSLLDSAAIALRNPEAHP